MKIYCRSLAILAFFATIQVGLAQAPAGAPSNATGLCNDGTYTTGATKKGACREHKGIKDWYAAAPPQTAPAKSETPKAKSAPTAPAPSPAPATSVVASGPAPAGATGVCNDGTYATTATKKGACRGHKGVKDWYATAPGAAKASTQPQPTAPVQSAPTPVPAPAQTVTAPSAPQTKPASARQASSTAVAPGGGPGQVWLNTSTKVYHCYGTRYYGKTKAGAYMSEADAKSKGAHGDRGKDCPAQ